MWRYMRSQTTHNCCICTVVVTIIVDRCTTCTSLYEVGYWMSANRLKLNLDKTELLWARSRRYPFLGDCGATLKLGVDTATPSNDVRVLGVTVSSSDYGQACLCLHARLASIGCGNCDVCGGHWTLSQRRRSFMPSSRPTLTIATHY